MKFICIIISACIIHYATGQLDLDEEDFDDVDDPILNPHYHRKHKAPAPAPAPAPIDPATTLQPYVNQKMSDIKTIADTVSAANAPDAAKAMVTLGDAIKLLQGSFATNLAYYIYSAPSSTQDLTNHITNTFAKIELSVVALLQASITASSSSLQDAPITAVHNKFNDLSAAITAFGTAVGRITDDPNIANQFDSNFVTYLKLIVDSEHQLYTILAGDIFDLLDRLLKDTLKSIIGPIVVRITNGSADTDLQGVPYVHDSTTKSYGTLVTAFGQTFDLLPQQFSDLYGRTTNAVSKISSAQLTLVDSMKSPLTANDLSPYKKAVKTNAIATESAVLDLCQAVSNVFDALANHITPEILLILQHIDKVISYTSYSSYMVMKKVTIWIGDLDASSSDLLSDLIRPLDKLEDDMDYIVHHVTITQNGDLNQLYGQIKMQLKTATARISDAVNKATSNL